MIKKIFIILLILISANSIQEKSEAILYSISKIGEPIITENSITQKYKIDLLEIGYWELSIKPLMSHWVNNQDMSARIPVNNTELITPDGTFRLIENTKTNIYNGDSRFSRSIEVSIKINNTRGLKSGFYTIPLMFSTGDGSYYTQIPTLQIQSTTDISSITPTSNIILSENDVFDLNGEFKNSVDTQLSINSNTPWSLYLDTSNIGNLKGDYYFQIISSTGNNITTPITSKTKLEIGQNYLIANGDRSYTNNFPANPIPTEIKIRYYLKNNTPYFFTEGTFTNNLIYRIEEK